MNRIMELPTNPLIPGPYLYALYDRSDGPGAGKTYNTSACYTHYLKHRYRGAAPACTARVASTNYAVNVWLDHLL